MFSVVLALEWSSRNYDLITIKLEMILYHQKNKITAFARGYFYIYKNINILQSCEEIAKFLLSRVYFRLYRWCSELEGDSEGNSMSWTFIARRLWKKVWIISRLQPTFFMVKGLLHVILPSRSDKCQQFYGYNLQVIKRLLK